MGRVYKWNGTMYVRTSSLQRWLFLLVGFTDPYNQTYYESLWWKVFKNCNRTQIQRQRHSQSAWKTQHILYFLNPYDLLIPNMMIDTSPWSSCSCQSPWLPCFGHTISSTGPSVSPFRDFFVATCIFNFHLINVHRPTSLRIADLTTCPVLFTFFCKWQYQTLSLNHLFGSFFLQIF